jgi:hypothetical protein
VSDWLLLLAALAALFGLWWLLDRAEQKHRDRS